VNYFLDTNAVIALLKKSAFRRAQPVAARAIEGRRDRRLFG
jgi:predicted nucleic acid-binding protein